MPEPLSVDQFITDTLEDVRQPLNSDFISKISSVRCTVYNLDEGLEADRNVILKAKKFFKAVVSSGTTYADHVNTLCDFLENLGQFALEGNEPNGSDVAASLCKFSVIHRDLANMTKRLMQNLNSMIVYPMESFMQGDVKYDFKKPFEKALKDYELKYDKLRKEKLQAMKESGIFAPDVFTEEMIMDLEKERRRLQLETCEYLIKVNNLKAKRSADLLQHLIDFFYAQTHYLRECLDVLDHFGRSMNDLSERVNTLHKVYQAQKCRLANTREELRALIEKETNLVYTAHSAHLNKTFGIQKTGYLLKRSEGKVKRLWQRRRLRIADGELWLYHADESKPPVRLMLLTCQVKIHSDNIDADAQSVHTTTENKLLFDLVSNNRTYNFQAEDEQEYEEWISVLNNAMQDVFNKAVNGEFQCARLETPFDQDYSHTVYHNNSIFNILSTSKQDNLASKGGPDGLNSGDSSLGVTLQYNSQFTKLKGRPLHLAIQSVLRICAEGNNRCADCNQLNPEWVSVNLGVLICLECCGVHREFGVHHSRTQSLLMDDLTTNQLLLPRFVGNRLFNSIFESNLTDGLKPVSGLTTNIVTMSQRRAFIKSKYMDRRFIIPISVSESEDDTARKRSLRLTLLRAVKCGDIGALLQAYAEKFDLMSPFEPDDDSPALLPGTTALHVAIERTRPAFNLGSSSVVHCTTSVLFDSGQRVPHNYLPLIEFIVQNSPLSSLKRANQLAETALHHAARHACVDALKLLVQAGGTPSPLLRLTNDLGQTARQLVESIINEQCSTLSPNDPPLDSYKTCLSILRLAESVGSSCNSPNLPIISTNSFVDCNSYNNTHCRSQLFQMLDQLDSVNWNLVCLNDQLWTSSQSTDMKPDCDPWSPALMRRTPFDVDLLEDTFRALNMKDSVKNRNPPSRYRYTLATLPRKKGPAPRPPSIDNQFGLSSEDGNPIFSTLSRLDLGSCRYKQATEPNDHIDVLLDVLEEKPSNIFAIPPVTSASPMSTLEGILDDSLSLSTPHQTSTTPVKLSPFAENQKPCHYETLSSGESNLNNLSVIDLPILNSEIGDILEALYDCEAEREDELSFRRGELIQLIARPDDSWWEGTLTSEPNRRGMFPVIYVRRLPK